MRFYKAILVGGAVAVLGILVLLRSQRTSDDYGPASAQAVPIDLSPYTNATVLDNFNGPKDATENNLADFPLGEQKLADVPFDISGIVQLRGLRIQEWGRTEYPIGVKGIKLDRPCRRVFLLHGASAVSDTNGTTIAQLVLHYSDDSVRRLNINAGCHVADWWGDTGKPVTEKGSELAWSGLNPEIHRKYGGGNLRIYKSTFFNPQPKVPLVSVDYVSTMHDAAPFLLGLTVD